MLPYNRKAVNEIMACLTAGEILAIMGVFMEAFEEK